MATLRKQDKKEEKYIYEKLGEKKIIISNRESYGLNTASRALNSLAKKLIGKKGFTEIDILLNWEDIIGEELSTEITPMKINFKRGEKTNGILQLATKSGAYALEIQHRENIIIDKINSYFGYKAVSGIKIIQNSAYASNNYESHYDYINQNKEELPELSFEEEKNIRNITCDIENEHLRKILEKLGKKVAQKSKKD
jgi:hypothetical protein